MPRTLHSSHGGGAAPQGRSPPRSAQKCPEVPNCPLGTPASPAKCRPGPKGLPACRQQVCEMPSAQRRSPRLPSQTPRDIAWGGLGVCRGAGQLWGPQTCTPSENPRHAQPSRGESGPASAPIALPRPLSPATRAFSVPVDTPTPQPALPSPPGQSALSLPLLLGHAGQNPCPVPGGAWHQPAQTPARPETRAGPARAGRCRPRLAPGALGAPRCPPVLSRTPPRSAGSHRGRGASRPESARLQAAGAPAGISLLTWEALHLHR